MQGPDPEMGKVDPDRLMKQYNKPLKAGMPKQSHVREIHTDSSFERMPPSYTVLRLGERPQTGGGMSISMLDLNIFYQAMTDSTNSDDLSSILVHVLTQSSRRCTTALSKVQRASLSLMSDIISPSLEHALTLSAHPSSLLPLSHLSFVVT